MSIHPLVCATSKFNQKINAIISLTGNFRECGKSIFKS
jgi:hypothetical protein